ncbi:MAG: head-tail joining protein [Burkholderiales bacterium]
MSFAELEARSANAVMSSIANATATVSGGASFSVIFNRNYVDALGISTNQPAAVCADADCASLTLGSVITIGATTYTVREVQPDGTGITTLLLELA